MTRHVDEHVATLIGQLTQIVGDEPTARAIFQPTGFHRRARRRVEQTPEAATLDRIIDLLQNWCHIGWGLWRLWSMSNPNPPT